MNRKARKAETFLLVTLSKIPGYFVTAESFTLEDHIHPDKRLHFHSIRLQ